MISAVALSFVPLMLTEQHSFLSKAEQVILSDISSSYQCKLLKMSAADESILCVA